jgi:hypothetical protein
MTSALDKPDSIEQNAKTGAPKTGTVEWQPIETAPKDGRKILVWPYWSDGLPESVSWRDMKRTSGRWEGSGLFCTGASPTHWMPLPAPPLIQGERP